MEAIELLMKQDPLSRILPFYAGLTHLRDNQEAVQVLSEVLPQGGSTISDHWETHHPVVYLFYCLAVLPAKADWWSYLRGVPCLTELYYDWHLFRKPPEKLHTK